MITRSRPSRPMRSALHRPPGQLQRAIDAAGQRVDHGEVTGQRREQRGTSAQNARPSSSTPIVRIARRTSVPRAPGAVGEAEGVTAARARRSPPRRRDRLELAELGQAPREMARRQDGGDAGQPEALERERRPAARGFRRSSSTARGSPRARRAAHAEAGDDRQVGPRGRRSRAPAPGLERPASGPAPRGSGSAATACAGGGPAASARFEHDDHPRVLAQRHQRAADFWRNDGEPAVVLGLEVGERRARSSQATASIAASRDEARAAASRQCPTARSHSSPANAW